jgi:hypothetical protein
MSEKCVICDPKSTDSLLCFHHLSTWVSFVLDKEIQCDNSDLIIGWAATKAREALKKEIREILKYWKNEDPPDEIQKRGGEKI